MDIFVINSLLKYKAKKAFKKFLRNKLKIKAVKPLVFNKTKRQKRKVAIITKVDEEEIIRKPQLKQKMKYLYYSKTLAKHQHFFHRFIFISLFSL